MFVLSFPFVGIGAPAAQKSTSRKVLWRVARAGRHMLYALTALLLVFTAPATAQYRVSSGDVLDITVFRVPELSRQLTVDISGRIAFPPVGEIEVEGETPAEIGASVRESLQNNGILNDAQVTVALVATRPLIVGGHVATPGTVPFHAGLTVRRAIAMAGGVTLTQIAGIEEVADIRSRRDVVALEMTWAQARAARLTAELAGNADAELTVRGPYLVSAVQLDDILDAETRLLRANLDERAAEKAYLVRVLDIIDAQVADLQRQTELQKGMIDQILAEIARQRELMSSGLAARTRVVDEQVVLEGMLASASNTANAFAEANEKREAASHDIARFDERSRAEVSAKLAATRLQIETARAEIAGANERLAYLGLADSATDVLVEVFRSGPEGDVAIPATQDTIVQPGDFVQVTIDLSSQFGETIAPVAE